MILREPREIDVKEHFPLVEESSLDLGRAVNGIATVELSREERAELLDVKAWGPMLETYGRTMKVAVALTDIEGSLLGSCQNAQPIWTLLKSAIVGKRTGCPFCLAPSSPCAAVAEALRTGLPTIVRDQAGLTHVAVPLSLGNHRLGAIIAGQVSEQYPESLLLQRAAKKFGVSAQLLWHLSSNQRPVSRATLQMAGDLLGTLGQAFLRQRYAAILETHVAQMNLRFRLLVEGVTDYALFTTDHLGRVTSWNVGAERMLGYPQDEIVGQQFSRMFTLQDIQDRAPEKQLLKASQEGRAEDEGWRVRENQTQFWANVIITPLAEEADSHRGFALVMQDVTDRRKAAIELEAVRQERIDLQEQFLSHVSHELRTPLTAIYFFITNLLEGVVGDLTSGQREHLEFSLENVKQLKDMVSDLVDVSRVESLKLAVTPQQTFVPRLIDEVLRTCRANAALKNISLLSDIAQCLPPAWADRARVRQVLINLIDNGIKFTPNNGTVTVRGRVFAEDSSVLCLSVGDTGCGISPGDCQTVFDRLAQVKTLTEASRKGLGLGLFISKELVSRQGGQIWVDSQLGHGSTFCFTLPVFSLAKLCDGIFIPTNLAAGCVTLLSIDVPTSDGIMQAQDLTGIRKVLEHCTLAGQDLLLPSMTDAETVETFFIIACADTSRADAMTRCLHGELDNSRLKPVISVTTLQLSANDQRWEERIAEITTRIDKLIQVHLLKRSVSNESKENSDYR
jgi:PAS domain S-box-containing protein